MKLQLSILAVFTTLCSFAQQAPEPAYKRFPNNVPLNLLLTDSSTAFTPEQFAKKKQVLIVLFSPDCEHCKEEARSLVANAGKLKKIQVVMASMAALSEISKFYEEFGLQAIPDLVIGKDINYLLPAYYSIKYFPFFAFYDKKKQLISVHEGSIAIDQLLAKFD